MPKARGRILREGLGGVTEETLDAFVRKLERTYHCVPYHNFRHAVPAGAPWPRARAHASPPAVSSPAPLPAAAWRFRCCLCSLLLGHALLFTCFLAGCGNCTPTIAHANCTVSGCTGVAARSQGGWVNAGLIVLVVLGANWLSE